MKLALLAMLGGVVALMAQEEITLERAQALLPSTPLKKLFPTQIPGLFGVIATEGELFYLFPAQELILFGEIYNKNGQSLSAQHRETHKADLELLSIEPLLKLALLQQESDSPYGAIIFTDPDCPFCQALDSYLAGKPLSIYHIYTPLDSIHPHAREKAMGLLMEQGLKKEEALATLSKGEEIAHSLGLQGTPQSIIFRKATHEAIDFITGFNQLKFDLYLKEKQE